MHVKILQDFGIESFVKKQQQQHTNNSFPWYQICFYLLNSEKEIHLKPQSKQN